MSNEYSLYPTLNRRLKELIEYSRFSVDFSFAEGHHEKKILLETSSHDTEMIINDLNGSWSSDSNNLYVTIDFMIETGSELFNENGIASKDAQIGIALQWYSKESRQRKTEVIGSFSNNNGDRYFSETKIEIPKGLVRKSVTFSLFLFILESDKDISIDQSYKANKEGMILGELDNFNIIIDGEGSDFPLTTYLDMDGPLWKIVCNWEDPTEDLFNDTVTIQLNRGHKDYRFIDSENKKSFVSILLDEIILNSYEIIINKLRSTMYMDDVEDGRFSDGSVAAAINYLISTFEIDYSSEETLAASLRNKVNFGG